MTEVCWCDADVTEAALLAFSVEFSLLICLVMIASIILAVVRPIRGSSPAYLADPGLCKPLTITL